MNLKWLLVFALTLKTIESTQPSSHLIQSDECDGAGGSDGTCSSNANRRRYLLYDVNNGEGFNLRRDVYMRVAGLVKRLRSTGENWLLVLPPWGFLYHWFNRHLSQSKLPWSTFFDVNSLGKYVPVVEFGDFMRDTNGEIDSVFYLQNYQDAWSNGEWKEKYELAECNQEPVYFQDPDGKYFGHFWGHETKVYANNFTCVSFQGMSDLMFKLIGQYPDLRSIHIDRAEVMLHSSYGQVDYWNCRRSMRFAKRLVEAGNRIRTDRLDSNDVDDRTVLEEDWTQMKRTHGSAIGGPYIGVHLRRRDFLSAREDQVPTLKYAAKQIQSLLKKYNLTRVYLATDTTVEEIVKLKSYLKSYTIVRYEPTETELNEYKDGGVAIIDQWICAHARHFIGTFESTFTFRIQEEREILGFEPDTTFNRLCNEKSKCEKSSVWKIVY